MLLNSMKSFGLERKLKSKELAKKKFVNNGKLLRMRLVLEEQLLIMVLKMLLRMLVNSKKQLDILLKLKVVVV